MAFSKEKRDERSLRLRSEPNRGYLADMKSFSEMGLEAFSSKPVTSGPYRVVSWNDNEMVAVPNPTSWRKGKVPNLKITSVPEPSSRIAALESGQTDIIYFAGPDDIPRIRAAGHTAVIDPAPYVAAVALFTEDFPNKFNKNGKTPLADKRLRQAFNYAVNRGDDQGVLEGHHPDVGPAGDAVVLRLQPGREALSL